MTDFDGRKTPVFIKEELENDGSSVLSFEEADRETSRYSGSDRGSSVSYREEQTNSVRRLNKMLAEKGPRLSRDASKVVNDCFTREGDPPIPRCNFCAKTLMVDKVSNLKRHLQSVHGHIYDDMMELWLTSDIKKKFFQYDEGLKLYRCVVDGCERLLKGADINLRRHITHFHPQTAETVGLQVHSKKSNARQWEESASPESTKRLRSSSYQDPSGQEDDLGYKPTAEDRLVAPMDESTSESSRRMKTIILHVSPEDFLSGLVEKVAVGGVPLSHFDTDCYWKTTGLLSESLEISSDSKAMITHISDVANAIRSFITSEAENRSICLKYDAVTYHKRKVFGIHMQYLENGKVMMRTLSVKEMSEQQTGGNLLNHIEDVLRDYRINIENVYSGTTDRGKMLTCPEKARIEPGIEICDCNNEECIAADLAVETMLEDLQKTFAKTTDGCTDVIRCAANILHVVAKHVLNSNSAELLDEIRDVVKATKNCKVKAYFEQANVPLPRIDCGTWFESTWDMLTSIVKHESFYENAPKEFQNLRFNEETWAFIREFAEAFEPLSMAMKTFQKENLTLGDAYKTLKKCQYEVKSKQNAENRFFMPLHEALEQRMKQLLESKSFKAALIFDQRWCFMNSPFMTHEDKLSAVDHLLEMDATLNNSKSNDSLLDEYEKPPMRQSNTLEDEFEAMIAQECVQVKMAAEASQGDLKSKLLKLANAKSRLPASTDIIKYWQAKKYEDPTLYQLAITTLAAPASQLSMKKCFSAVSFIVDQDPQQVSEAFLNDLLIIRCNQDLLPLAMSRIPL